MAGTTQTAAIMAVAARFNAVSEGLATAPGSAKPHALAGASRLAPCLAAAGFLGMLLGNYLTDWSSHLTWLSARTSPPLAALQVRSYLMSGTPICSIEHRGVRSSPVWSPHWLSSYF